MNNLQLHERVNTQSAYYKKKYGQRVFKIPLSTGIQCPQRVNNSPCVFCQPDTFIDQINQNHISITDQINLMISKIHAKTGAQSFIAYFQENTSTYGDPQYLINCFKEADKHPQINELVISTRPDYLNEIILSLLKNIEKPLTIELGVQTTHDKSLLYLNRNHTQKDNQIAIELIHRFNQQNPNKKINIAVHLILGIPGESKTDMIDTIHFINQQDIDEIKFHHLVVYKNTPLENLMIHSPFKPIYTNLEEYCELLSEILSLLKPNTLISRFFTSNLIQDNTSLNQFPGIKKTWLNQLTKTLNNNNIHQGLNYNDVLC